MKIAVLSIALTLGVSLASANLSLSNLREKGKAAVTNKIAPVKEAVKAAPAKAKAKVEEKKTAAKAAVTSKTDAAKAAVTAKKDSAKATVTAKADAAKAAVTEKTDAAKTAVTAAVVGDSATGGAVLGALTGTSSDAGTASQALALLSGTSTGTDAGTASAALAALPDSAKEALTSKFTAQQSVLEQLSALKSGSSTGSLDSLKTAVENYQKADAAMNLLNGELPSTDSSTIQSLFSTSESLDSSITTEAAALLLQNKESSTPGITDVLQLLAN